MRAKTFVLLIGSLTMLNSCSHLYTPTLYHQDIAYMPKPMSSDTVRSKTYASAGIASYTNTNYNDFLVSWQFNVSRGYVFDGFNIAYGAFGVLGQYQNSAINEGKPNYFTDKFFGDIGGRFSANTFVTSGRTDLRLIGVEMAYSHEFGSFADFRQHLNQVGGYYVDPRTDLFSVGLTSEIIFHNRNDIGFQNGIRGFLGQTLGHDQLDNTFYNSESAPPILRKTYFKVSYFITFKNFFGTLEAGKEVFVRFGLKF